MNGLSAFHLPQICCFEVLVRWGQPNGKDPIPDCLEILAGTLLLINGESCCSKVPSIAGPHTFGVILSGDRLYSNYCHKDPRYLPTANNYPSRHGSLPQSMPFDRSYERCCLKHRYAGEFGKCRTLRWTDERAGSRVSRALTRFKESMYSRRLVGVV